MRAEADPVVRLAGVGHRYGRTTALEQVDLAVARGRMVGLIGPDGVGKSTLLGLIAGVKTVQAGQVVVLGGSMADERHRERVCPEIAYMPQGLGKNLYPTLSVAENLHFFGRLFGQKRAERLARIEHLTRSTGLFPFLDRPAGKLSGGMKQKLGLCSALIHDPELLILDEPTTGVDPLSRRQFWSLIGEIRQDRPGMTVLVATATMDEARRFDRLVAIDGGRILAEDTPERLLAQTGADDLEEAFIRLLPEERRRDHVSPVLPPRTSDGGPPVIEAHGLTQRFGSFTAVDHVDLRIERGEIFGFLGSNGAGKTTTMKMLTGLLPATEGTATLLGKPIDASDLETRRRVGYMSQAFSLYDELTVRQNLELHARLFELPAAGRAERIATMLRRFELTEVADQLAQSLPLGVKQRLSLAVAVLHEPELLILDEPTSGVDPIARDRFWAMLIRLSREDGVTIFLSTHFMGEAERCDRISFMHAGRVLEVATPAELKAGVPTHDLDDAFVAAIEKAAPEATRDERQLAPDAGPIAAGQRTGAVARTLAWAAREAKELQRDTIRLVFAVLGPIFLMFAFGYGISFDVENVAFAVLDQDQSPQSRALVEEFRGSRYFEQQPDIADLASLDHRLQTGELKVALVVPPDFGRDLEAGRGPEIGIWVDGAMPFRGETARGYAIGVAQNFGARIAAGSGQAGSAASPFTLEIRYRYNQEFESIRAIVPGVVMLLLVIVPAMLTALAVVREKETGGIINFYVTPTRRLEFLVGKQLPYVAVAYGSFVLLVGIAVTVFGLSISGSILALALGGLLYVLGSTAVGLLFSTFVNSQVAALFGTAIATVIPAINFSGFMVPVSSLSGFTPWIGRLFPSAWFQIVSVGTFAKGSGLGELLLPMLALAGLALAYLLLAALCLRRRET
ncbi:MAG TPA: ribosome-associated ATPase/putative transporter RbbA [Geminicoccus sp.]|uniref:ribosome-associated ATPase/putative transporter RbbA n=1 Tax=Geminicoccus sp. TaxID=2024832 RepID=UPI002CE5111E|nr:ribosome-associated ATPase/putative transporter RbbA [Geminicoccus sp.]HWL71564.1 ribosome-associated ATPase/putative transporter RbbA [Geminicoccus sp.]